MSATSGQNITKTSVHDEWVENVQTPQYNSASYWTGNYPYYGSGISINTGALAARSMTNQASMPGSETNVTASTIVSTYKQWAHYATVYRVATHGWNWTDNGSSGTYNQANSVVRMTDGYKLTHSYSSTLTAGSTIDAGALDAFFTSLNNEINSKDSSVTDLRVCHTSCHSSCHGSRGRR